MHEDFKSQLKSTHNPVTPSPYFAPRLLIGIYYMLYISIYVNTRLFEDDDGVYLHSPLYGDQHNV